MALIIEILTIMTSLQWKTLKTVSKDNCLSYIISKFERKLNKNNWNMGKRTWKIVTSYIKFRFFYLGRRNDDVMMYTLPNRYINSYLQVVCFPKMQYKLGVDGRCEELWWIQERYVFTLYWPIGARADFELWRTTMTLLLVQDDWK